VKYALGASENHQTRENPMHLKHIVFATTLSLLFTSAIFASEQAIPVGKSPHKAPEGAWFSGATSGMIGGTVGSTVGWFGAFIGCLCGYCVPRGKGRKFIMGLFLFAAIIGLLLLSFGIVAMTLGQPWHVWYPFILMGGIMLFVFVPLMFVIRNEYAKVELRKMMAMDA
jgi:hypothetical protein